MIPTREVLATASNLSMRSNDMKVSVASFGMKNEFGVWMMSAKHGI
jgi:hypothetical protein